MYIHVYNIMSIKLQQIQAKTESPHTHKKAKAESLHVRIHVQCACSLKVISLINTHNCFILPWNLSLNSHSPSFLRMVKLDWPTASASCWQSPCPRWTLHCSHWQPRWERMIGWGGHTDDRRGEHALCECVCVCERERERERERDCVSVCTATCRWLPWVFFFLFLLAY